MDSSKIRAELGWAPEVEFESGMKETIQWYKDNRAWWEPLKKKLNIAEGSWDKDSKK